jgi:outer membrane protein assembly factor BamB
VKAKVLILCLVILGAGGYVLHLYSLQRRPPGPDRIPFIKWTRAFDRPGFYTSPIVGDDGSLYIGSEEMYSLDPSSAVRWEFRVDLRDLVAGGLLQDEAKNIYFATMNKVYSLSPAGLKRWETSCREPQTALDDKGSTFDGNRLYTMCGQNFAALNKDDGTVLWTIPALDSESTAVMLRDGTLLFVRYRQMYAVDRDGKTIWKYPQAPYATLSGPAQDTYIDTPIAVGPDETLYAGSRFSKFAALDPHGTVKWTFDSGEHEGFRTSPVVESDGTVVAISVRDVVYAFAPDGTVSWKFRLPKTINASRHAAPIIGSDGTIYILAERMVIALSAQGKIIWQLPLQGTTIGSPALAPDGTLYVATVEQIIYAVQTGSHGLMQSFWPKYQHDSSNSGRTMGVNDK